MHEFLLKLRGRRMPGVCGWAFCGAVALVILLANGPTLEAAPVTFAFEATVNRVSPGASFDSKINLAEGDVITGQFTFEPNAGDGSPSLEVDQPYSFTVNINGIELSTAAYRATVRNDMRIDVDCVNLSCPSILDVLKLEGNSLSSANNTMLMDLDTELSRFRMGLVASADPNISDENFDPIPLEVVLEAAEIPSDSGTWNQFSGRLLQVWLVDDQGGSFSLNASVGLFTVVPEPSSGSLICLGIVVAGTAARTDRRLQKQR